MKTDTDSIPICLAGFTRFIERTHALGDDPAVLTDCLEHAAEFMRGVTAADVLAGLCEGSASPNEMGSIACMDHVGFLAPLTAAPYLSQAAEAAGFAAHHRTMPSSIISRELGSLAGRGEVETTIFRAVGVEGGSTMEIEVYVAHGADKAQASRWIRQGIGPHIAFRMTDRSRFGDIASFMETVGFEMPPFFGGRLMTNEAARISVAFFDKWIGGFAIRLEFCHYLD